MTVLIEPQCISWQHEMVNAGYIDLFENAFPYTPYILYADKAHIKRLESLLKHKINSEAIELDSVNIHSIEKEIESKAYFKKLFEGIIERDSPELMVLLSSHRGNIVAATEIAKKHPKVNLIIVLHAIAEQMLTTGWQRDIRYKRKSLEDAIESAAECENIKFITYSPSFNNYLKGKLSDRTLRKVYFLHHPYPFITGLNLDVPSGDKLKISVYGASCNNNAVHIMKKCDGSAQFVTMSSGTDYSHLAGVTSINGGNRISREEIEEQVRRTQAVMIPYDKMMYRCGASGVFFDAINYGIPTIMLDSPLLKYYNDRFNIGWMFKNCDDCVKCLSKGFNEKISNDWKMYHNNMHVLKDAIKDENIKMLTQIINK